MVEAIKIAEVIKTGFYCLIFLVIIIVIILALCPNLTKKIFAKKFKKIDKELEDIQTVYSDIRCRYCGNKISTNTCEKCGKKQ